MSVATAEQKARWKAEEKARNLAYAAAFRDAVSRVPPKVSADKSVPPDTLLLTHCCKVKLKASDVLVQAWPNGLYYWCKAGCQAIRRAKAELAHRNRCEGQKRRYARAREAQALSTAART